MYEFSKHTVPAECTTCGTVHKRTLAEVAAEQTFYCSCGTQIQLKDNTGSVAQSIAKVEEGFKILNESLRRLNRH